MDSPLAVNADPLATTHRTPSLRDEILYTLLYYDIWRHPLTGMELFAFLPTSSLSFEGLTEVLGSGVDAVEEHEGYYFVRGRSSEIVRERKERERRARRMWTMARIAAHVVKRFPFVRGVFVSGELSKNAASRGGDIDFLVITAPGRLWIARCLLILFKKTVLLNSKKFFCLNSFAASNHLEVTERNIYQAMEIATLKPLYNSVLFERYLAANAWVSEYFPNFTPALISLPRATDRHSALQKLWELPFALLPCDRIDEFLMGMMRNVWKRRYPHLDDATRIRIFRCTRTESRAYVNNFQDRVLTRHREKLKAFGMAE